MKNAFTMIELIWVIVILGILSAVAIPRLAATREDAQISKGASQVAAIRSGIALQKSANLMQGNRQTNSYYPDNLDGVTTYNTTGQNLFYFSDGNVSNILESPIRSVNDTNGRWVKTGVNVYDFQVGGGVNTFTYNSTNGTFNCTAGTDCTSLTQ